MIFGGNKSLRGASNKNARRRRAVSGNTLFEPAARAAAWDSFKRKQCVAATNSSSRLAAKAFRLVQPLWLG